MTALFGLFAKSPFGPLVKHTTQVQETVELLHPLFEAFFAGDGSRLEEVYQEICRREHRADETKAQVRDHLPRSVFLPINRGDILTFIKEQDSIADAVEDLGVILTMRTPEAVPELEPKLSRLVDQVVRTTGLFFDAAREIATLQAASFTGPEVDRVLRMVADVNRNEWEADQLQAAFSKTVFQHEGQIDPISVFQWMHIAEVLGDVADHAENTGDMLRLMLTRS